jgi:hypothetical protein
MSGFYVVCARGIVRRKAAGQLIVSRRVHTENMSKRITIVTILALVCATGAYYWAHGSANQRRFADASVEGANAPTPASTTGETTAAAASKPSGSAAIAAATVPPVSPLRSGEVLEFAADVAKLTNVANLRLQIVERRNFFGKNAWHLQAFARTENPLRMVFELDDQFDSYSDASTLSSLQYEMHLNERGQKQESIQRMKTTESALASPNATETRVRPGTRDPLGLMQYLRTVDWTKTHEVRSPVYDGHKLYDVTARLASSTQDLTVPAGRFATSKIDIHVFDPEGQANAVELKDAHFAVYLANNASRVPVLLEAVMPFATARVALVKVK